jgi:hypothetical protein
VAGAGYFVSGAECAFGCVCGLFIVGEIHGVSLVEDVEEEM